MLKNKRVQKFAAKDRNTSIDQVFSVFNIFLFVLQKMLLKEFLILFICSMDEENNFDHSFMWRSFD